MADTCAAPTRQIAWGIEVARPSEGQLKVSESTAQTPNFNKSDNTLRRSRSAKMSPMDSQRLHAPAQSCRAGSDYRARC